MRNDEHDERETLLQRLMALNEQLETTLVPEMVELILSIPLTMQQVKVLTVVITGVDGSTVQTLARVLGVSLATMSGIVDRLESQGMVSRQADPGDNRVRRVMATPNGRDAVQQLVSAQPQLNRYPLQRLTTGDLLALERGMAALVAATRQNEDGHQAD